jgi:hypothetical protein
MESARPKRGDGSPGSCTRMRASTPAGIRTQMPVQGGDLIGRCVYRFHHGGLDDVGEDGAFARLRPRRVVWGVGGPGSLVKGEARPACSYHRHHRPSHRGASPGFGKVGKAS